MKKLVLIDGNSLINRAFYATPPMSNSKGVPTNAVLSFVNMLVKLAETEKPDYLLVAYDRKEPTFRHLMYEGYKANRKAMPDDLRPQIELSKTVLDALGVAHFELAGSEADDIIGSLAGKFNVNTIIVTGDKDSFQLVDGSTTVNFTRKGITETEPYTADNFREKMFIDPLQIIDLKALMGDKSDNIPGVPGVGEKTALDLITRYGTAEGVYDHIGEIGGKLREKLENGREMCILSKKLATIDRGVNTGMTLDKMEFSYPFPGEARELFAELEFRAILKKEGVFCEKKAANDQIDRLPEVVAIKDKAALAPLFEAPLAVHIGDNIDLSDGKKEYVVKVRQTLLDEGFSFEEALAMLRPLFENENSDIILFSVKKTEHILDEFGITLKARVEDVSLQKYIVDYTGKEETLAEAALYYHLPENTPAFSLYSMNEMLHKSLKENGQLSLYLDIELPLARVLFDMEKTGFKVDTDIIASLNEKYKEMLAALKEKIYALAGEPFNINSPKQLAAILFDKLGLYHGKKKRSSYSTSAEILEEISSDHEIVPYIMQYRRISKLNSTYVEGFLPLVDKRTGIIHTVFNQTLTSTGRLSSKEPNLQNLPIRNEEGKEIRRFFVPSAPDRILVGADYSQIELRLLAHFSGCGKLIEAYQNGEDIHALTASQVFGVPLSQVTKEMRQRAKAVNFGIIYGISEYGLAKNIKTTPAEAKAYIDKYFASYPHVRDYMAENVDFARKNGFVSTICGRKRYIKDINSPNYNLRSFSERAAMNMPLQGSSADIIKIAMIAVDKRLKEEKPQSHLVLQVHDELVVDAPEKDRDYVCALLKKEMEGAVSLRVPLVADAYFGKNLSEAK